jgi:hypothetical protein
MPVAQDGFRRARKCVTQLRDAGTIPGVERRIRPISRRGIPLEDHHVVPALFRRRSGEATSLR